MDRTHAQSVAAATASGNRRARAAFSSHNLGLAVDFSMSDEVRSYEETETFPMQGVVDMRESSVHRWLFLNAHRFGWYPYHDEPWHWEFNPPGFREVFLGTSSEASE